MITDYVFMPESIISYHFGIGTISGCDAMPRPATGYDLVGITITGYHFGIGSIIGCDTLPSTTSESVGGTEESWR